jgi:hypothetical protein
MNPADAALVRVAEYECDPRAFMVDREILKFTGCIASAVAESWLDRRHERPSLPIDLTHDDEKDCIRSAQLARYQKRPT